MFTIKIRKKPYNFAKYILQRIKIDTKESISSGVYTLADKAIREYTRITSLDSREVIRSFINRFTLVEKDADILSVGQNGYDEYIEGTDKKISELVRLIEFGTTGVPPVPKLSKVINSISQDIEGIYERWKSGSI